MIVKISWYRILVKSGNQYYLQGIRFDGEDTPCLEEVTF